MKRTSTHRRISILIATLAALLLAACAGGGGSSEFAESLAMISRINNTGYAVAFAASAGTWTAGPTSVTANLISSAPALGAHLEKISAECHGYTDVSTYDSLEGLSPITLQTSTQSATATYDGREYSITGLVNAPGFAASNDTLTLSATDANGGTVTASVATPPAMTDPNLNLGAPNGLATVFSAPDGAFDVMYVFVALSGSSADAGASCEFPASAMTAAGAYRTHALVDDATAAWIAAKGLTPTDVYVAWMKTAPAPGFFKRDVELQAGQMFHISASNLGL